MGRNVMRSDELEHTLPLPFVRLLLASSSMASPSPTLWQTAPAWKEITSEERQPRSAAFRPLRVPPPETPKITLLPLVNRAVKRHECRAPMPLGKSSRRETGG